MTSWLSQETQEPGSSHQQESGGSVRGPQAPPRGSGRLGPRTSALTAETSAARAACWVFVCWFRPSSQPQGLAPCAQESVFLVCLAQGPLLFSWGRAQLGDFQLGLRGGPPRPSPSWGGSGRCPEGLGTTKPLVTNKACAVTQALNSPAQAPEAQAGDSDALEAAATVGLRFSIGKPCGS